MNLLGFNRFDLRLLINLLKMNIRDRYLGSSFGILWAIVNPIFMLSIFTYVFGFVFKIKIPGSETTLDYVIWLISGYGPWLATTESIMAGAASVVGATGIVKNMAFKTELLPIAATFTGLINLVVSLIFLFALIIFSGGSITWHIFLLPLIVMTQFIWLAAITIWLSAIAVFIRDILQLLPNILLIILFVTPIFYPFENMPNIIKLISYANPFFHIAESYRSIIISNNIPNLWSTLFVLALSLIILISGLKIFRRMKEHFDSSL